MEQMLTAKASILDVMTTMFPDMNQTPNEPLPGTSFAVVCSESNGFTIGGYVSSLAGELYEEHGGEWGVREREGKMVFGLRFDSTDPLTIELILQQLSALFSWERAMQAT